MKQVACLWQWVVVSGGILTIVPDVVDLVYGKSSCERHLKIFVGGLFLMFS